MSSTTPKTAAAATEIQPIILRAQGVNKTYRIGEEDLTILKQADLTVRRGEFVAIEGRSGSGKSTLLHILGGLDSPTSGTLQFENAGYQSRASGLLQAPGIRWLMTFPALSRMNVYATIIVASLIAYWMNTPWDFGRPFLAEISIFIVAMTVYLRWEGRLLLFLGLWACIDVALLAYLGSRPLLVAVIAGGAVVGICLFAVINTYLVERPICRLRNKEFGFVFQFYHLLPELNVLENTLLSPLVEKSWFRYRRAKENRHERATKLLEELGLAHRLRHKPNQLSGGERQRVAIARALMNSPKILFADEPTGNLDYETGRQIMGVLEKLHQEKNQTIVMVTHDRSLASEADRVLVLRNGRLERPDDKT